MPTLPCRLLSGWAQINLQVSLPDEHLLVLPSCVSIPTSESSALVSSKKYLPSPHCVLP